MYCCVESYYLHAHQETESGAKRRGSWRKRERENVR
jgi:hypothetical protein